MSEQLSAAELEAPINRSMSISSGNGNGNGNGAAALPQHLDPNARVPQRALSEGDISRITSPTPSLPGSFGATEDDEVEDWGGDLMDVNDDDGDWSAFSFFR